MKRGSWTQVLMAAAMILIAGAVHGFAEAGDDERPQDQRVVVDINGAVQTIGPADLADGESRQLAAGPHTVTVTRSGQKLEVLLDGKSLLQDEPSVSDQGAVAWIGKEGEDAPQAERVVVMTRAEGESAQLRTVVVRTREGEDEEELTVDVEAIADGDLSEHSGGGGGRTMIFTSAEPGSEPVVVAAPDRRPGMVRYRCEATGSELLVARDRATADSYVCPATGCVMTRVAEPEVRVIKVIKKLETGDDEPTE